MPIDVVFSWLVSGPQIRRTSRRANSSSAQCIARVQGWPQVDSDFLQVLRWIGNVDPVKAACMPRRSYCLWAADTRYRLAAEAMSECPMGSNRDIHGEAFRLAAIGSLTEVTRQGEAAERWRKMADQPDDWTPMG